LLAQNRTWQCPTLVWERGGNLLDVTDLAKDTRAKYVPAAWKNTTWKRFTEEITQGYGNDDLTTRKKFIAKELEIAHLLHEKGVLFLAGTDTPPGVYIFPRFSLHEESLRFVAAGFTPLEALHTATITPARSFNLATHLRVIELGKLPDIVRRPPSQNVKSRNFRDWHRVWITRNNFNLISRRDFSFASDCEIETASPARQKFLHHVVRPKSHAQFVARQPRLSHRHFRRSDA